MQRKDIQRDVKLSSSRAPGDAPVLGRVARMKGSGMPKGERRRRMISSRDDRLAIARRRTMIVWSSMITAATAIILGYFITSWLGSQRGRKTAGDDLTQYDASRIRSKFPSPSESDALLLVYKALENREPDLVHNYFRPADEPPGEIIAFLETLESKEGKIQSYNWVSSMDANGMSLEGVLVTFQKDEKQSSRLAILTPDDLGVWRMDYASFARVAVPPIEELMEQRANQGIVRVTMITDNYYNGPFSDDKKWVCYAMAIPQSDELMLGYCKIGSPQALAMKAMFSRDRRMSRGTLEVSRVPEGEARQFEILRVLAEDWVMGEIPFDERFR